MFYSRRTLSCLLTGTKNIGVIYPVFTFSGSFLFAYSGEKVQHYFVERDVVDWVIAIFDFFRIL